MMQKIPSWFRLAFVIVMLACCFFVVTALIDQSDLQAQIDEKQSQLTVSQERTKKLVYEKEQAIAALPGVEAKIEELRPDAEPAMAHEQELRDQREALKLDQAEDQTVINTLVDGLESFLETHKAE